jgi:DivIVA domain-containing protein
LFIVEVVLGVIVVLTVALLLAAAGGGLPSARPDTNDPVLPADRLLTSADIPSLRLRTAVRGYRMEDVDAVMGAVHASLWAAEQELAAKNAQPSEAGE